MAELAFASARQLARKIERREIGCLELLDYFIKRIEQIDSELNAVVVRDFDRARSEARALDRKRSRIGPLHGVPMTVKESFDVAGLPTTWGLPEARENIPTQDALAVQRLKAAGAIIFGKTNVPKLLADWQSYNRVYGVTKNPWDPARSPGGSSGGAAAALAAGLTGLELGSDIGGSIRQPAHACGVFGHKPSWGLCSPLGHSLKGAVAMTDISVIGPLARSAEDLSLVLDLIAGPDPVQTEFRPRLPPPRAMTFEGLRVAVWSHDQATETDAEITELIETLGRFLRKQGARVNFTARPAFDPKTAYHLYLRLLAAALGGRFSEEELAAARARAEARAADDVSADAIMDRSYDPSHRAWLADHETRVRFRRAWGAFFQEWDVLLCPVIGTPAFLHALDTPTRERRVVVNGKEIAYNDMLFWPGITCGFHLPATAAPLGLTRAGLPVGVQVVGPYYGDQTTLAVARLLERHWRRFEPPPAFRDGV